MLLMALIVPALNWTLVLSRFAVARDGGETARRVLANEPLFRVGVGGELITAAVAVVLAVALYVVVRSVDEPLALVALLLKLVEAILWAVVALGHLAALVALKGSSPSSALVGSLLRDQVTVNAVPGVFLGLSSMAFLYLLVSSKYVPRMLAGFGTISYALVLVSNLLAIASSSHATVGSQLAWGAPSVLAELALGSWLLIRGISVRSTA